MKVRDFSGKTIDTGIDMHLKQWTITIYMEGNFHKTFSQDPNAAALSSYLEKTFPNGTYRSVYEAGYFGYVAHRELMNLGIMNRVINPADVPTTAKEKTKKNDKVDSNKLARGLWMGAFSETYVPSVEAEGDRDLVRHRISKSRKEMTSIKQQIKAFLKRKGQDYNDLVPENKGRWTLEYIKTIKELKLPTLSDQLVKDQLVSKLEHIKATRKALDKNIIELSRTDKYEEQVRRLRTIPGVGLLTAMTMLTEIIEMDRFKSLDRLCSYMGLVPDTEQSDEKMRVKGLTKRTNHDVRRILIQSAWQYSMRDPGMLLRYGNWKQANGNNAQKAIIKVAKRLLSIIRALWLKQEDFAANLN